MCVCVCMCVHVYHACLFVCMCEWVTEQLLAVDRPLWMVTRYVYVCAYTHSITTTTYAYLRLFTAVTDHASNSTIWVNWGVRGKDKWKGWGLGICPNQVNRCGGPSPVLRRRDRRVRAWWGQRTCLHSYTRVCTSIYTSTSIHTSAYTHVYFRSPTYLHRFAYMHVHTRMSRMHT